MSDIFLYIIIDSLVFGPSYLVVLGSFWCFVLYVKYFTETLNDISHFLHIKEIFSYSEIFQLLTIPLMPPSTLTALFSCSMASSTQIAKNEMCFINRIITFIEHTPSFRIFVFQRKHFNNINRC